MYHKLAGMTGTAENRSSRALEHFIKLDVVNVPTNVKVIRKDEEDMVYKTKREKFKAVIEEVEKEPCSRKANACRYNISRSK